jgi:DsbC/DsbD-like thiol-disulfide interchange protein
MGLTTLRRTPLAIVFACLALAAFAMPVCARAKKSSDVVKATAEATKPDADGNQTVTLTLNVEKPYHIYANPVGLMDLEDAATVVSVDGAQKPEAVKVDYPAGEVIKDKALGDYKVYEGKVTIKAQVRRAKGDTGELTLTIKLQACDDKSCLPPGSIKVTAR